MFITTISSLYLTEVDTCVGQKAPDRAKIIEEDASKLKLNEAVLHYSAWASFGILQTRTSFKGAFATLDGKKQDAEANKSPSIKNSGSKFFKGNNNDRKTPVCPCGERHYFNKCEHINVSYCKPGYIEDHKINARIQEWVDSNPEKYEKMVSSFEKTKGAAVLADFLYEKESYATITESRVFSSRCYQDHSAILDTATTNHVFHQFSRFIRYEKLKNPLEVRTSDSNCFIIGTGSIRFAVITDKGQRYLRINNVQHIPGFHINIIAHKAFKYGGAYLDGKMNRIRKVKDDRCVAICETSPCGSFLVLENSKSDLLFNTSFATNSSEQKVNTATAERWHLRLGNMSHENIAHLSHNVDGQEIYQLSGFPMVIKLSDQEMLGLMKCRISVGKTVNRKTLTDFGGNLPTPRATFEISNKETISRETSHERVDESEKNKRSHNRRLAEEQVLERLRETSREARARRRNQRKENLNFYTEVTDIDSVPINDSLEHIYSSFAVCQNRRLHIDQLKKPPSRWETMLKHPESSEFISAANFEIQSQEEKGTWTEVPRPANIKVLRLKWIFTYKSDDQDFLVKYKARFCVRGDL
ncbi:hypothetical protein K3495_g3206 [Podosphaera aphanis]|nr:hypothetical protein K3495_g3206 [Podosphaera aphanis]